MRLMSLLAGMPQVSVLGLGCGSDVCCATGWWAGNLSLVCLAACRWLAGRPGPPTESCSQASPTCQPTPKSTSISQPVADKLTPHLKTATTKAAKPKPDQLTLLTLELHASAGRGSAPGALFAECALGTFANDYAVTCPSQGAVEATTAPA